MSQQLKQQRPWRAQLGVITTKARAAVLAAGYRQQAAALFWKNVLVAWRSRRSTVVRLLAPLFFLILALLIKVATDQNSRRQAAFSQLRNPSATPIPSIPDCHQDLYTGQQACVTFLFTPNTSAEVLSIIERVKANNVPPIVDDKVLGFARVKDADDYMVAHGDGVLGAVHLTRSSGSNWDYLVQANGTRKSFKGYYQSPHLFFQVPMQSAVAREIARQYLINTNSSLAATMVWAPEVVVFSHPSLRTRNIVNFVLGPFIFASCMFGFVTQISQMVGEKELGLRQALRNMGMRDSAYWTSWALFDASFGLITSLAICIFGMILRFDFFLKNDFGMLLMVFWLFQLAMTAFSYLVQVFTRRAQTAVYAGFSVFVVGWMFQIVVAYGIPYKPLYLYDSKSGPAFFWIFNLFPWNPFIKAVLDLAQATNTRDSPGLKWSQQYSYCQHIPDAANQPDYNPQVEYHDFDCVFPIGLTYINQVVMTVIYFVLGVYLDNVYPNENGVRRPALYPFSASYWRPHTAKQGAAQRKLYKEQVRGAQAHLPAEEYAADSDVVAEEARLRELLEHRTGRAGELAGQAESRHAIELFGLQKVFNPSRGCCGRRSSSTEPFWAIKGSWLGIEENQLFCLLGPNGAGKTTTINCLTGVLPYTSGDALVYGESVGTEGGLDQVRSIMGVCPQFDVLWGQLTAAEHLSIYGNVKGIPVSKVQAQAATLLEQVKLTHAAGMRTSAFSGGMKRRLSVAIALLGDPKVVYLDEPTTGMDPISRRFVWDIIQAAKAGRAIVLTTHSMEEADALGDRIAIMARGRVRALGSSIRLKQKFGAGYQLSISVMSARSSQQDLAGLAHRAERLKAYVRHHMQGLEPNEETRSYVHYAVPASQENAFVLFLKRLEEDSKDLGVSDVQIALTSLEEVFLEVARKAELEAAAGSGQAEVKFVLPDGRTLLVPLGQDAVVDGATGVQYAVKWTQDDQGRLAVLDCIAANSAAPASFRALPVVHAAVAPGTEGSTGVSDSTGSPNALAGWGRSGRVLPNGSNGH